jgi:hypothetical protein
MNFPIQNIDFLKTLIKHNVRFLVIGGCAVRYHGYERDTGDLDVLAPSDPDNSLKIYQVSLEDRSNCIRYLTPEHIQGEKPLISFKKGYWHADIITQPDGIDFDEVYMKKCMVKINEIEIPVIGKCDLITMKLNSNREDESARQQDINDAQELKKL